MLSLLPRSACRLASCPLLTLPCRIGKGFCALFLRARTGFLFPRPVRIETRDRLTFTDCASRLPCGEARPLSFAPCYVPGVRPVKIGFKFRVPACCAWRVVVSFPRSRNGLCLNTSRTVRHPGSFGLKPGTLSFLQSDQGSDRAACALVGPRPFVHCSGEFGEVCALGASRVIHRFSSLACAILKGYRIVC